MSLPRPITLVVSGALLALAIVGCDKGREYARRMHAYQLDQAARKDSSARIRIGMNVVTTTPSLACPSKKLYEQAGALLHRIDARSFREWMVSHGCVSLKVGTRSYVGDRARFGLIRLDRLDLWMADFGVVVDTSLPRVSSSP